MYFLFLDDFTFGVLVVGVSPLLVVFHVRVLLIPLGSLMCVSLLLWPGFLSFFWGDVRRGGYFLVLRL